jgi:hypothetical protein
VTVAIEFHDPDQLSDHEIDAVVRFMSDYFQAGADELRRLLRDCDELIVYRDSASGAVCGITRLSTVDIDVDGVRARGLVTRSVVLAEEYRGRFLIHRAGFKSFLRHGLWTRRRVYWFSTMNGYRAYLLAVRNLPDVWPRRDATMPAVERSVYDTLLKRCYPSQWDPSRGVCSPNKINLAATELQIPSSRGTDDPDLQFYCERNPDYARGDALPVLVPLTWSGFLSVGMRMVRAKMR